MELTFMETLTLGLISGLAEILPVSAEAHRVILSNFFGAGQVPAFLRLMIHASTVAALYLYTRSHIVRIMRAQRLAKIPKRRRKRPLDTQALMDFNLMKTTLIPTVLAFLLYGKVRTIFSGTLFVAAFLLLNGLILYIPQFLPGANKDSGAMTRIDGFIFGLAGSAATLPGISCLGTAVSICSVQGMEAKHAFRLALLLNIPVNIGFAVYDILDLFSAGSGPFSFGLLLGSLLAGAAVLVGIRLGIRLLNKLTDRFGYPVFAFYSWGAALFTFIFYLLFA